MIESHDVELVALSEFESFAKRVAVIFVVAKNKSYVQADFMTA